MFYTVCRLGQAKKICRFHGSEGDEMEGVLPVTCRRTSARQGGIVKGESSKNYVYL
jgi:hypothetical protein